MAQAERERERKRERETERANENEKEVNRTVYGIWDLNTIEFQTICILLRLHKIVLFKVYI